MTSSYRLGHLMGAYCIIPTPLLQAPQAKLLALFSGINLGGKPRWESVSNYMGKEINCPI